MRNAANTWLMVLALGCSHGGSPGAARDAGPTEHDAEITPGRDASSQNDGSVTTDDDACTARALAEPRVATTYYVAIEEPGADNDACDGTAARDEGAGHCPFKDFSSPKTLGLLDGVRGVRVELRRGTYVIHGWGGVPVRGAGTSESERVVLSAYAGEHPVLDVAAPDGASCTAANARQNPDCVRQVLDVSGTYTTVQGLTIQNGLAYHVAIVGGAHHVFRCNTLHETVAFPMRSDCLKIAGDGHDIQVLHNDFSRFRSQAIDMTQVSDVLIEDNDFHDPVDADGGATGTKFGAHRVMIRGNRVHDFGASTQMHAFSLGGTGSGHPDDHAAYEVQLIGNHVSGIAGILAQLVSCVDCVVADNVLSGAGAGVLVSSAGTGDPNCTAAADGCGPNTGARITGNRMRNLDGGGDPEQADTFIAVDQGEETGLVVDDNTYCATGSEGPRFEFMGHPLTLNAWRQATSQDARSQALNASDPTCQL